MHILPKPATQVIYQFGQITVVHSCALSAWQEKQLIITLKIVPMKQTVFFSNTTAISHLRLILCCITTDPELVFCLEHLVKVL